MHSQTQPARELRRSAAGMIAGVCAGLSEYLGVSVIVVRAVMVILALVNGLGLIAYFILFLVIPAPRPASMVAEGPGDGRASGAQPTNWLRLIAAWCTGIAGVIAAMTDLTNKIVIAISTIHTIGPTPAPPPPTITVPPAPTHVVSTQVVPPPRGTYWIGQHSDTDPHVTLTQVQVGDSRTVVRLRFENTEAEPANISAYPPSDPHAFFIAAADGSSALPLRDVSGIALAPQHTTVQSGTAIEFALVFDQLDAGLTRFHLIEGLVDDPEATEWIFSNIALP
jgi:phage shock protein PspC (stress-responsive transcriptional regulator)